MQHPALKGLISHKTSQYTWQQKEKGYISQMP